MKKNFASGLIALSVAAALAACSQDASKPAASAPAGSASAVPSPAKSASELGTPDQQLSYALGMDIGRELKQLKDNGTNLDGKLFNEGLEAVLDGKTAKITEDQKNEILMGFVQQQQAKAQAEQAKQQEKLLEEAKANLAKGEAFLKENAKKDGVKTTASGLQYKVKTEGKGAKPAATDTVTVEYEGRLIDGTVFDSSAKNGAPATFPLNQVIPGWTEGVQLMGEGGEYTFYIPAKLAYGPNSTGLIPGNSTLVFDVKLVKVEKAAAAAPSAQQSAASEKK